MKKISILCALLILFGALASAALAQETEAAVSSILTNISLPKGALRVTNDTIPAEIKGTFDKLVAQSGGKLRQGEQEVLVWSGANYSKAAAQTTVNRLTDTLKIGGWRYAVEDDEGGLTVFSLVKESPARRALVGFYGATDDTLVLAWAEMLSGDGAANVQSDYKAAPVERNTNSWQSILGTWTKGMMSMMGDKNQISGAVTPSNGTSFKYVFHPNGSFEFVGYMQSTMYGCTTSLFQDKRGKYRISGNEITLTLSKNFWRNQYGCSPASNKERDYNLDSENYTFRTKTDEYGKTHVCLTNAKGETCYRREE
jgi:hypothetical protein